MRLAATEKRRSSLSAPPPPGHTLSPRWQPFSLEGALSESWLLPRTTPPPPLGPTPYRPTPRLPTIWLGPVPQLCCPSALPPSSGMLPSVSVGDTGPSLPCPLLPCPCCPRPRSRLRPCSGHCLCPHGEHPCLDSSRLSLLPLPSHSSPSLIFFLPLLYTQLTKQLFSPQFLFIVQTALYQQ